MDKFKEFKGVYKFDARVSAKRHPNSLLPYAGNPGSISKYEAQTTRTGHYRAWGPDGQEFAVPIYVAATVPDGQVETALEEARLDGMRILLKTIVQHYSTTPSLIKRVKNWFEWRRQQRLAIARYDHEQSQETK